MALILSYFEHTKKYAEEYGDKTIVLMMVGSFYEMYGEKNSKGVISGSKIEEISKLCDLFMGFKTEQQRAMFYDMLQGNGHEFLHFSVGAVLEWNNTTPPPVPFIQILGSQDKLFSHKKIRNAHIIEGSGHFTAFEKGKEVSEIIVRWTEALKG